MNFPDHQTPEGEPTYLGEFYGIHVWYDGGIDEGLPFMCLGRGLYNSLGPGIWLDGDVDNDPRTLRSVMARAQVPDDPEFHQFLEHLSALRQLL